MTANYTPVLNLSYSGKEFFTVSFIETIKDKIIGMARGFVRVKPSKKEQIVEIIETNEGVLFISPREIPLRINFLGAFGEYLNIILNMIKQGGKKVKQADERFGKILKGQITKLHFNFRQFKSSRQLINKVVSFIIGLFILLTLSYGLYRLSILVKKHPLKITWSLPQIKINLPKLSLPKFKPLSFSAKQIFKTKPTPVSTVVLTPTKIITDKLLLVTNGSFDFKNFNIETKKINQINVQVNQTTLFYQPQYLEKAKQIAASLHTSVVLIEGDGFPQNANFFLVTP